MKKFFMVICIASLLTACGKETEEYIDAITEDTLEEVVDESNAENDTQPSDKQAEIATDDFSFQYLAENDMNTFIFASGVGAWGTEMEIDAEGSFKGVYYDADMGVTEDEYPNGMYFTCNFSGQFGDLEKIDDLTYKTTLIDISCEQEPGKEEIIDGTLYVYTTPYGLDGDEFYFYLPGTPVDTLSEEAIGWLNARVVLGGYDEPVMDELPCTVIYNSTTEDTWDNKKWE